GAWAHKETFSDTNFFRRPRPRRALAARVEDRELPQAYADSGEGYSPPERRQGSARDCTNWHRQDRRVRASYLATFVAGRLTALAGDAACPHSCADTRACTTDRRAL